MPGQAKQQVALSIKVARVLDEYTLVINKGANDGIKAGHRFLVYSLGEEIIDPDTQNSLGNLEVVKGTGKVTHIQPTMATIQSDMKTSPAKTIRRIKKNDPWGISAIVSALGTDEVVEETLPTQTVPFEAPEINDIARPI